jgi:hypothetical protein
LIILATVSLTTSPVEIRRIRTALAMTSFTVWVSKSKIGMAEMDPSNKLSSNMKRFQSTALTEQCGGPNIIAIITKDFAVLTHPIPEIPPVISHENGSFSGSDGKEGTKFFAGPWTRLARLTSRR